ncbi:hypothetical protein HYQ46_007688 [Verticillium longisporum]|nr:hypothetical protein HYQ46_007688 [Verticillium longisporum]
MQRGSDSDGNTDSLIQRLSVLSVSLHELSVETGKPAQPATTIRQNATPLLGRIGFRCDDYPIDSILMTTQTFVEILSGFIQMESCQCAELALKVQTRSDEGLSQLAPDVDSFPTFTGDEDHFATQTLRIIFYIEPDVSNDCPGRQRLRNPVVALLDMWIRSWR